jgi:hypothetical protein
LSTKNSSCTIFSPIIIRPNKVAHIPP